jgi:hypothetical protein
MADKNSYVKYYFQSDFIATFYTSPVAGGFFEGIKNGKPLQLFPISTA